MQTLLLWLIRAYQLLIRLWLGAHCRFYPSCSEYAQQAIGHYGAGYGSWLALKRILRCNPWHAGGIDPVPGISTDQSEHFSKHG